MSNIWEDVKNHIKKELPEKNYSLWISPLTLLDDKSNQLTLGCPNRFSYNWIKENYQSIIEKKLTALSNDSYTLSFKVTPTKRKQPVPDMFKESKQLNLPNVSTKRGNSRRRFNRDFTFDRFVVGDCNEFAYSASKAMALGDTWSYDSLFMLSKTGLGKSHLSQSIGHAILDENPNVKAYYITAEDFVNEMIFAIKNNRIDEFKNRYRRSCDVLLLEEVHFLSGKEKTQLELGYTLDALANDGKKIIFTSSLLPDKMPNMTKELASRLTSGIITTLEKPDYKTRLKIIEKKSIDYNLNLLEEIKHYLAKYLTRDVRQIESALRCLRAKAELLKAKIDMDLAREVIKCHLPGQNDIAISDVKKVICRYFKIDPEVLHSRSRKKIHSFPRNIYVYLCRTHTDATLEEIGRSIDRNHSTVLYSFEVIEKKIKIENNVKKQVDFLNQKLKDLTK